MNQELNQAIEIASRFTNHSKDELIAALRQLEKAELSEAKDALPSVHTLLTDKDPDLRCRAICVISAWANPEIDFVIPTLLRGLDDEEPLNRCETIEALSYFDYRPVVPKLIHLLKTDPNELVRLFAAEHLGYLGDSTTLPDLFQALEDYDRFVVRYSIRSIGLLGNSQTLDALRPYINRYQADEDLDLLCEYYLTCYRLGDRSALATLNEVILQKQPHSDICMTLGNQIDFLQTFRRPSTMDEDEHVLLPSIAHLEKAGREYFDNFLKNNLHLVQSQQTT